MSGILYIAVCEDIELDAQHLCSLIRECPGDMDITRYADGEAFLSDFTGGKYHLVFMDIYMGGMTGMEAARLLREKDEECALVFTTSSTEHALEAFGVAAAQYLVKPVAPADVRSVLQKRRAALEREEEEVMRVNARGAWMDIPFKEIVYIEVRNHNCLIHTSGGVIETGTTMRLEDFNRLITRPNFLRCHRAFIVNFAFVDRVEQDFIMKNGDIVYIRQTDLKKCARAFKEYLLDLLDKGR